MNKWTLFLDKQEVFMAAIGLNLQVSDGKEFIRPRFHFANPVPTLKFDISQAYGVSPFGHELPIFLCNLQTRWSGRTCSGL